MMPISGKPEIGAPQLTIGRAALNSP